MAVLARRKWLALAPWLFAADRLWAAPPVEVLLLGSERGGAYQDATNALIAELERAGLARERIRQATAAEWEALAPTLAAAPPRLCIALGAGAATALARREPDAPVLCALLPRMSFERLARAARGGARWSALYLDQPPERTLDLIRLCLPKARRVGVLWSEESRQLLAELEEPARARGLRLSATRVQPREPVFNDLRKVLEDADVLLALPDPNIYNSNSIQNILLTAYRTRVPLIGFSPAYVRAGGLAAVYSSPAQIGAQTGRLAAELLGSAAGGGALLQAPRDFAVSVNDYVARSLGLDLDAPALEHALRRLEKTP